MIGFTKWDFIWAHIRWVLRLVGDVVIWTVAALVFYGIYTGVW